MKYDWLALPGIPAGSSVWEKLPVRALDFKGVQDQENRKCWALDSFVSEVLEHYDHRTILIGHDLGGVVSAMAAIQQTPRAVVLSGTALGHWWFWTRLSAKPVLNRFFYHTFKGNLFLRMGGGDNISQRFRNHPHYHEPEKMKELARYMRPPTGLVSSLRKTCPVYIIWGKREIFYPGFLGKSLSRRLDAPLYWNDGGHYCMWTHSTPFHETMKVIENAINEE